MKASILGYGTYLPRYRILREEIARAWGAGGVGRTQWPGATRTSSLCPLSPPATLRGRLQAKQCHSDSRLTKLA